jgi:hypothetical protein
LVVAWQPPWELPWELPWPEVQVLEEDESPAGGPRDPAAPFAVLGPAVPAASLCTVPAQPAVPAWQLRVAVALDQLEAPGTVGEILAPEPGEPPVPGPVGGVEGCDPELPVEPPPPEPLPEPPPEPAGLACVWPLG